MRYLKTIFIIFLVVLTSIFLNSCDKNTKNLKKYYGVWEIKTFDIYSLNNSTGEFDLFSSYSTQNDTATSYFTLYDYLDKYNKENLGTFKFNSNIVSLLSLKLNGNCFFWYVDSDDVLCFWDGGNINYKIDVTSRKSNKMEFTFIAGNQKEVFSLARADV